KDLFDDYADRFETHLDQLDYRAPELLRNAILKTLSNSENPRPVFNMALDIGCGTGKCGELFRPFSKTIHGVDLSSKMTTKAGERNVYDHVFEADAATLLKSTSEYYDLVIAADVLIYIGDLNQLFSALETNSVPDRLFAFSTETCEGDGFKLLEYGRFAHSVAYIHSIAEQFDYSIAYSQNETLRQQSGQPVPGRIFILKKN
ncbi:MAG TPA: methyltransferase domain-containing protein, partial [Verrucomicrobia bacterium]|nr:methyltransferase domain-containing protein [Verrucomicrobiota bacterium]